MSAIEGTKNAGLPRNTKKSARWKNVTLAGVLTLSLAWSLPALAVTPAQDEPTPLNLGQMARGSLLNGENVVFTFEAPDDATYVITTADDAEAEKFDLILTSEDGEEIYNDIFETLEFDLDDGDYTLELVAVEDGEYSLFVAGEIGDLSDNSSRPGDLIAGSFVIAASVSGDQYATIEVPETDFWQQVAVTLTGDEGASFSATVTSEDYSTYEYITDSATEGPLRFFSMGGEYDLTITPAADGPLTVVVLTSGPAPALTLGEPLDESVTTPSGEKFFVLQPSGGGGQVTVTLTSDSEDVDLDLSVSTEPGADTNTSSQTGSNESVTVLPINDAPLYVRVYAYDISSIEEPVPFTLLAEEGEPAAALEPDVPLWGNLAAAGSNFHLLDVPEGGAFVTVYLYGNTDNDVDLRATISDESGANAGSLSSSSLGSAEVIADFVETPTTWTIEVDGTYTDEPTSYLLVARVETPASFTGQWAVDAEASSEYGESSYSAMEATGEPNVPEPADDGLAWTSLGSDAGEETLDLTFATAVVPAAIDIYESFNPGAIIAIAALDPNSNEWITLWEGNEATNELERVFSPELESPDFATDQIRIVLDTSLVPGWNEIDAVELFGLPAAE